MPDVTQLMQEWRRKNPGLPIRLRPQSIYEHAKDRDDAIRLLEKAATGFDAAGAPVLRAPRRAVTTLS